MSKKAHEGDDEAGPSASGLDRNTPGLLLTMADLQKLPFTEHVTQFKCIEGWSQIVHWGGYRLRDFLDAYPPQQVERTRPEVRLHGNARRRLLRRLRHVRLRAIRSRCWSRTCTASRSRRSTAPPLRLFMPIKYGYKNVKRIGLISYTDTKPDDYWTKLGYDWYAGL